MLMKPIAPGSIVDVIAPASRASTDELRDGVRALRDLGLVPRVPRNLFAKSILFSNSDEVRFAQLKHALVAPDSDLVWCVRGGYGALRLLPELARVKGGKQKMLLGYSDITTLHVFLNQKWGWPTLHGPLLDRFGGERMGRAERKELLDVLFGRVGEVRFTKLRALNRAAGGGAGDSMSGRAGGRVSGRASASINSKNAGRVRAPIVGGNFAVLQSSLGTPNQIDTKGRILFLEDTGERPHRVDRMLTQFTQAGLFAKAKAVVFGHFQLAQPEDRRNLWQDVMKRFAAEQTIPVLAGLPVGHDAKVQRVLPLGTRAELSLGDKPELRVKTGVEST